MQKVVLRTYSKLWKIPFKIYSIDNLKLLIPINPWDVVVFSICLIFITLVGKVLFFIEIPFVFKYGIFPWAFTKLIGTVKLDGKKPYKYFYDMFIFRISTMKYERFKAFKLDKLVGFKENLIIGKKAKIEYDDSNNLHEKVMKNLNVLKK